MVNEGHLNAPTCVSSVSLSSMVKQPILCMVPPVRKKRSVRIHMMVATERKMKLPVQSMFAPCFLAEPPAFPVAPTQHPTTYGMQMDLGN